MNLNKEFYEILELIKEEINDKNYKTKEGICNKDFLKQMLNSNPNIMKIINLLKDKNRSQQMKNNNIFNQIKNQNKKNQKENKIIIESLDKFSIFYNEPKYIKQLNETIYKKITDAINEISKEVQLIGIINGYFYFIK
jgi:hypothetical protein